MQRWTYILVLIISTTWVFQGCAGKKGAKSGLTGETDVSGQGGASESDASSRGGAPGGEGSSSGLPTVHFGFNEYTISAEDREKLKSASDTLKSSKGKVTIEGHCDERGSNEYNLALGEKRAQAVKSYLQKVGVNAANLSAISYGEERPVDSGHGEDAWAKNRRGDLVGNR